MKLEQEEIKSIVEGYFKKKYNKNIEFDFCRINYGTAVPVVAPKRKGVDTVYAINYQDIEKMPDEQIAKIISKKYPDAKYININDLKNIFLEEGYKNPHFLCSSINGKLMYSVDVNSNRSFDSIPLTESIR